MQTTQSSWTSSFGRILIKVEDNILKYHFHWRHELRAYSLFPVYALEELDCLEDAIHSEGESKESSQNSAPCCPGGARNRLPQNLANQ